MITVNNNAIIAFKNILGKSNTDVAKEASNEAEGIFFNVPANSIWMDPINSVPATSVAAGFAVAVTAVMVVDLTSNGHALFANWPVSPPSGTDPKTASPFSYGTGSLVGIGAGDRVRNAIPPTYGTGYEAKPYAGGNLISPGDPRDWIYQYNSGVFFQQDGAADIPAYGGSAYTNPTTLQLYVYIGQTLATFTGGGSISEWYNSVFSIEATPPMSPSVGDRYLLTNGSPGPSGAWSGHDDKIVEWNGSSWTFTTPATGGTVLVDDEPGYIYIYTGTYPSGLWNKVPFGTTRAGIIAGTDTYTITVSPPITAYVADLILLGTFLNTNTGASTLNINGLGAVSLLKSDGIGSLVSLDPGDIVPGIIYMIGYDGYVFQLFTGGGGGSNGIPLTGTVMGAPVTGDIEVDNNIKIYTNGSPVDPGIQFTSSKVLVDILEVNGSGTTSATYALKVNNATPSTMFSVRDDGFVNSVAGYSFNGNRILQGDAVTITNVFVGPYPFNNPPGNTGSGVIGIGYGAAQSNTGDLCFFGGTDCGSGNSGSNVFGLGTAALQSNSGNGVYVIGYQVARGNTGNNVFAVGSEAAYMNTMSNVILLGKSSNGGGVGFTDMFIGVGPNRTTETIHEFSIRQGTAAVGQTDKSMSGANFNIVGAIGTGTGVGGDIVIKVAPAGTTGSTQNATIDAMTVKQTGNIGVNITPTARLHVKGSDTTSSNFAFKADSSTETILSVRNDHTIVFDGISSGFTGSNKFEKQSGVQTTNATVTTIATIATASDEMTLVTGTMLGYQSTYAAGYGSKYFAVFRNVGGTVTQVSTPDITDKHDFGGSPTTTFAISGTDIQIKVTGMASTTINWVASYEYTKVKTNS